MVLNDAVEKLQAIFRIIIGQSSEAEWVKEKSKSDFESDSDWVAHLLKIHKCHCSHGCIATSLNTTVSETDANHVTNGTVFASDSQSNATDRQTSSDQRNYRTQSVTNETGRIPPASHSSDLVKRHIVSTSESDDVCFKKKSKRKRRSPCHRPRDDEIDEQDQASLNSGSPSCSVDDNPAPEQDCLQIASTVRGDAGTNVYMDVATDSIAQQSSGLQDVSTKHEKVSIKAEPMDEDGRYGNMPTMVSGGDGTDPGVHVKTEPDADYDGFNIHESRYLDINDSRPYVTSIDYIASVADKDESQFNCFQVPIHETESTSETSDTFPARTAGLQNPQPHSSMQSQNLPMGHDYQAAMCLQAIASRSVSDSIPNKINQSLHSPDMPDKQSALDLPTLNQLQWLHSQKFSHFNQTNYDELIKSLLVQNNLTVPKLQQVCPDIKSTPLAGYETHASSHLKTRQNVETCSPGTRDSLPEKSHSLLRSMLFPKVQVLSPAATVQPNSAQAQLVSLLQMQNTRESDQEIPLLIDLDDDGKCVRQRRALSSPEYPNSDLSMLKTLLHERDCHLVNPNVPSSQRELRAFSKKRVGMRSDAGTLDEARTDDVNSSSLADLLSLTTCSVKDMLGRNVSNKMSVPQTEGNKHTKSSSDPSLDNTSYSLDLGRVGSSSGLMDASSPYSFNARSEHEDDCATRTPVLSSLLSVRNTQSTGTDASSSRYMEELLRFRGHSPTQSTRIASPCADPDPDCSIISYPEEFTSNPVTSSLGKSSSSFSNSFKSSSSLKDSVADTPSDLFGHVMQASQAMLKTLSNLDFDSPVSSSNDMSMHEGSSRNLNLRKTSRLLKELLRMMDIEEHNKVKINGRKKTCAWCRQNGTKTASGRNVESSWMCSYCKVCLCRDCFGPWHDVNLKLRVTQLVNGMSSSQAAASPSHEDPSSSSRRRGDAQSLLYNFANFSPLVSTSADTHRLNTNTTSVNSQRSSTSGLLASYLNQISIPEPVNQHGIKSEFDNSAAMYQSSSQHDQTSGHILSENTADLNSMHPYNTRRAQGVFSNRDFRYNNSDEDENSNPDSFGDKTFMNTLSYTDYEENEDNDDDDGNSTINDDKDTDYIPDEYDEDFNH